MQAMLGSSLPSVVFGRVYVLFILVVFVVCSRVHVWTVHISYMAGVRDGSMILC